GHEDVGFDAGSGGVGGEGAGGIAGRRDGDLFDAQLNAHGDGAGESASLEGGGGVEAFVLDPEELGSDAGSDAGGGDEGRPAFAEGDDGGGGGGQDRGVAPHVGGSGGDVATGPAVADDVEIVADEERASTGAEVIGGIGRIAGITETAFQVR